MKFSAIALLVATTVLGAPTEFSFSSGLRVRGDVDQGEGFYLAVPNNETGVADVKFTPLSKLAPFQSSIEADTGAVTEAPGSKDLNKRGTTCSGYGSFDSVTLDRANFQLARNADAHGTYSAGAHGWVHLGQETSFFCNYLSNHLTYDLILDMHTIVSNRCYRDGYRFDRRRHGGGANDLSVGRTWRGDHFC